MNYNDIQKYFQFQGENALSILSNFNNKHILWNV